MYLVRYAGVRGLVAGGVGEAGEAGGKRGQPHAATPCCHQKKKLGQRQWTGKREKGKGNPQKNVFSYK